MSQRPAPGSKSRRSGRAPHPGASGRNDRWARNVFGRLTHLLLPPACAGCGSPLPSGIEYLCPGCRTRLRSPAHPRCIRCHAPRGTGLPAERPCPECEEWPPILARARAACVMAPPADRLVHALKYGGWPELAPIMAERMTGALGTTDLPADAVVAPVPTTRARLRARGFNQAEELSRAVASAVDRVHLSPLRREGESGTQVALHRHERRANVEQAFCPEEGADQEVSGRCVLLVDDVLTTGATACAAASALSAMGVSEVIVLTFARALPDEDHASGSSSFQQSFDTNGVSSRNVDSRRNQRIRSDRSPGAPGPSGIGAR